MLKIGATTWIVLSLLLLAFPLGFVCVFLFKKVFQSGRFFMQKVRDLKALDQMRVDILQKRVQESEAEDIWSDVDDVSTEVSDDGAELKTEDPESDSADRPLHKEDVLKQKKLLEKLHYEALRLKQEGKLDHYEKILVEALAIEQDNKEFTQLLADLYFTMGQYNKALLLLKKLIEQDPQNHHAVWQVGEIYLITGDFETAALLIEKAIALKPSNPKYHISMVEVLYNTNKKKDAINIMEKVVRLRPSNTSYIFTLANLYEEIDDLDSAKKYYFRVLEYEPSNEHAKKKLKTLI